MSEASMHRLWMNGKRKDIHHYFWYSLGANGWKWIQPEYGEQEDYTTYSLDILGNYRTTCYAMIADDKDNLIGNGHYGVAWIDGEYENTEARLSIEDLEDIRYALEHAEDNLLAIGIPFCPDYEFHGRDRANKKRRNDAIRRRLGLEELEREHNEERRNAK